MLGAGPLANVGVLVLGVSMGGFSSGCFEPNLAGIACGADDSCPEGLRCDLDSRTCRESGCFEGPCNASDAQTDVDARINVDAGVGMDAGVGRWTRLFPAVTPPPRYEHAMAYDPVHEQVVVFGGWVGPAGDNAPGDDTWVWDGSTWTEVTPSVSPPARAGAGMAYDPVNGNMLLFGGYDGPRKNDTWAWDGESWTEVTPADSPSGRSANSCLAADIARSRVVLFGGYSGSYLGDTWLWDGSSWSEVSPASSPVARYHHALVYDDVREQVLLFGGTNSVGDRNDTWVWDGVSWTAQIADVSPPPPYVTRMAYHRDRGQVLMLGGFLTGTWGWDGSSWAELTAAPLDRNFSSGLAYDSARRQVVMFGGLYDESNSVSNQTWVFSYD